VRDHPLSAVVDKRPAEIGPYLSEMQFKAALMGLLVAGGMLIPGNIPNIIAAGKLGVTSSEWGRVGVPIGVAAMAIYFVVLFLPAF
jgi:predicted cation transporter